MLASDEELVHKSMQCLIQLAGLHGPVFADIDSKRQFAGHFLDRIYTFLKSFAMESSVKLSCCQTIRRLVETFRLSLLAHHPTFSDFFRTVTEMACQAVLASMNDDVDDTWNMEIFDELLETLSSLRTLTSPS
jgi:hypothetical protein